MKNNRKKLKSILERTGCLLLVFFCAATSVLIFFSGKAVAVEGDDGSTLKNVGYEWHLAVHKDELNQLISDYSGVVMDTERYPATIDAKTHGAESVNKGWARVMILWEDDDTWYYLGKANGNENIVGQLATSSMGINTSQSVFTTRSGLDTPFIKYVNEWCHTFPDVNGRSYGIRFCKPGTEEMSDTILSFQMSYYGVKYRAAAYGEFALESTIYDLFKGKGKHRSSCNYDRWAATWIQFTGLYTDHFDKEITRAQAEAIIRTRNLRYYDSQGNPYYPGDETAYKDIRKKYDDGHDPSVDTSIYDVEYSKGTLKNLTGLEAYKKIFKAMADSYNEVDWHGGEGSAYLGYDFHGWQVQRFWRIDGGEIGSGKYQWYAGGYKIYVGKEVELPVIGISMELEPTQGIVHLEDNTEITSGTTVTVPEGTTLVIDGTVTNNGIIYIRGGTLLVRGTLDSDGEKDDQGYLIADQLGTILVADGGAILSRSSGQFILLDFASNLKIDGLVNTPALFCYRDCTVDISPRSALLLGCKVTAIDLTVIDPDNFFPYRNYSIKSFFTNYTAIAGIKNASDYLIDKIITWDKASIYLEAMGWSQSEINGKRKNLHYNRWNKQLILSRGCRFTSKGLVYMYGESYLVDESSLNALIIYDNRNTISEGMNQWYASGPYAGY